jgi:hypothetical protein
VLASPGSRSSSSQLAIPLYPLNLKILSTVHSLTLGQCPLRTDDTPPRLEPASRSSIRRRAVLCAARRPISPHPPTPRQGGDRRWQAGRGRQQAGGSSAELPTKISNLRSRPLVNRRYQTDPDHRQVLHMQAPSLSSCASTATHPLAPAHAFSRNQQITRPERPVLPLLSS